MVNIETKSFINLISIITGVVGGVITYSGMFVEFPHPYYVTGSFLLLLTAIHYRLYFFVALEIILISGHTSFLLGIGTILQVALPILLCFQLLFYYFFSGQTRDFSIYIGIFGIGFFSVGFSIQSQWIFFLGSLSIAIFAFFEVLRSNKISFLWLILNLMFAITTLTRIIVV